MSEVMTAVAHAAVTEHVLMMAVLVPQHSETINRAPSSMGELGLEVVLYNVQH